MNKYMILFKMQNIATIQTAFHYIGIRLISFPSIHVKSLEYEGEFLIHD